MFVSYLQRHHYLAPSRSGDRVCSRSFFATLCSQDVRSSLYNSSSAEMMEELQRPVTVAQRFLPQTQAINHKELFQTVTRHFDSQFGTAAAAQQVPVLTRDTADHVPAGGLVRFRGMVVDMFNPEFFLGAYKTAAGGDTWRPAALFTDEPPSDVDDATQSVIMERRPLLLTPVPHEQQWATAAWAGRPVEPQTPRASDRIKRTRNTLEVTATAAGAAGTAAGGADAAMEDDTGAAAETEAPATKASKTAAAAADGADGSELQQMRDQGSNGNSGSNAAVHGDDEHSQQQPGYAPGDCIVQVYGECDHLKLHDVVEVLGVMSVVPELAALHINDNINHPPAAAAQQQLQQQAARGGAGAGGGDAAMADAEDFWQERVAALPPTSQVLRLHALSIHKVPAHPLAATTATPAAAANNNTPPAPSAADVGPTTSTNNSSWVAAAAPQLRGQVLSLLSAPLAGDDLAAEYLLLTCLSSVVGRDADGAVGVLPLNLSHCPPGSSSSSSSLGPSSSQQAEEVVPGLTAALTTLLPHVAPLPLSLSALNKRRWYPQQHGPTGMLFRGCLQQPEGALLLLDERQLSTGQLGDSGVKNLQALRQVLAQQQLPCGCQVYSQNLHTNQPAVLISSAGRSLLRDSCPMLQLPLQPQKHLPGTKPPSSTGSGAGFSGSSSNVAAQWANADVAGPDAIAAAAASMPELAAVRQYLAAARSSEVRLDQGSAEACVARFRALQAEDAGLGWQDLNTFITLSKLLCASLGQSTFSMECWDRAVQLERQRRARVTAMQR